MTVDRDKMSTPLPPGPVHPLTGCRCVDIDHLESKLGSKKKTLLKRRKSVECVGRIKLPGTPISPLTVESKSPLYGLGIVSLLTFGDSKTSI